MYYCTCIQCCAVLVLVLDRGTDYFILYMTHLSAICLYDMHSRICKTIVNTSREVLTSSHRIPLFPVSFCTAPPYFHHHHKHFIGVLFRCVVCCLGLLFVFSPWLHHVAAVWFHFVTRMYAPSQCKCLLHHWSTSFCSCLSFKKR